MKIIYLRRKHFALKNLINRDIVIQKANTVVTLNKNDYISKMKSILSDSSKFQKLSIDQNKVLNHIVHMKDRIIEVLKNVKRNNTISEKRYDDFYPVGSRPEIIYVLAKIHKPTKDGVPPFRPIISAIGKSFVTLLTPFCFHL